MTRRRAIALPAAAAVLGVTALAAPPAAIRRPEPPAQGQTTFRAGVDLVRVPVSVRAGSEPVMGLTASDFILTDNGVEQRLEGVDAEALPIDLTLVLDTSGSTELVVERLTRDVREMAALLGPDDRVRLVTIDTYATEVFPMQPAPAPLPLERLTVLGLSSVHDALAAALLRPAPLDRRQLVVAMTDGIDSISALPARGVVDVAHHSDAVLAVLRVDTEPDLFARWEFACLLAGRCGRQARYWIPFQDRELGALREAAEVTGGEYRDHGSLARRGGVAAFRQVLHDFRRSYLLRYTPRGVAREGWHRIEVRLRRPGRATVRARRGYAIAPRAPGRPAPPAPGPGAPLTSLAALTAAYERGDVAAVRAGLAAVPNLAALVGEFRAGGNPWPALPRREALFVLELAEAALYSGTPASRDATYDLLAWYQTLVRHPLEPDGFERLWCWAQVALVQGVLLPDRALPSVENALRRFPEEPRFRLARAVILDQRWRRGTHESPGDGASDAPPPEPAAIEAVLAAYEDAAAAPETRVEARIRQAWLLLRLGRHAQAAAALDVADAADAELVYLHRLVRGKALEALGDPDAADAAFGQALAAWPGAQSARVARMTLALRRGDRAAAGALAEAIETQPADSVDPFWSYWQGDVRFYPAIRELLRQAVR